MKLERLRPGSKSQQIPSWRAYQDNLKRSALRKHLWGVILKYGLWIVLAGAVLYGLGAAFSGPDTETPAPEDAQPAPEADLLGKRDIQALLQESSLMNLEKPVFTVSDDRGAYQVTTSLDPALQQFFLQHLDATYARYAGVVALEPATGRVLAMAGIDKTGDISNPCLAAAFPAASIFKIVTAAAAIEKCGYNADSRLFFNGRKYTLYKSQLGNQQNKWTQRISLKDSFAQSVNPVFGKLGALDLKKPLLAEYAQAFGFNRPIGFELPLAPSQVVITDEPYQWAEIASGFNRSTLISPLHGALMAALVLNNGLLVEPTIVDRITDAAGTVIYRSRPRTIQQAITPQATETLKRLMANTITSGTCRKSFRGHAKDQVLSRLEIGGKTGSILSRKVKHVRYDWFVGYARTKQGGKNLALSIMVAHEKYIGTRASEYARQAFEYFFTNYFADVKNTAADHLQSS